MQKGQAGTMQPVKEHAPVFAVARNPDRESKLPYLIHLPIEDGQVLKARETWPRSARVYCHPTGEGWPDTPRSSRRRPCLSVAGGERPST